MQRDGVDKLKYKTWAKLAEEVLTNTNIDSEEDSDVRRQRVARLEEDPEEWFRYYFPQYTFAPSAVFHREATERILNNDEWYEVRMWSRELAKSTRTMMEVFYLVLVGNRKKEKQESVRKRYVLMISNSLDNAERLLAPYKANLQYNVRLIQDYGVQVNVGNWQAGEFITLKKVAFRAIGAGQSPRGSRNDEARPDIIIFDDVDTDADCLNPEIVAKKWRWIEEAAIGTRSVSVPTLILFCGNRIAPDCCIERACKHADMVSVINIRNENGLSSWPEKNSEVDIDRVLSQKSYAAAQKEYFNNPVREGSVFKQMAYKPARQISEYETLVCYTDPSYRATGDYKATVLVGRWENEYHVIKCYLAQATTAQMIAWFCSIIDIVGPGCCHYLMEEVFMQDVLKKEIVDAANRLGITIPLKGDKRKKPDKFTRVETLLEPLNRNGHLYLNEYERNNPNMELLEEQFLNFAPGSHDHDDGPDAVEGAIWKMNEIAAEKRKHNIYAVKPLNTKRY